MGIGSSQKELCSWELLSAGEGQNMCCLEEKISVCESFANEGTSERQNENVYLYVDEEESA